MSSWHFASGIVSLFSALALCLIVLNRSIQEGLIIKAGLIGMIFSLLVTFALTMGESKDWEAYWRASFVTRCSVLVVCIGLMVRARGYVNRLREAIDIPCDRQAGMTRSILSRITEPAHDLAVLFRADSAPAPLESDKESRR